jgi:hypothetical protein
LNCGHVRLPHVLPALAFAEEHVRLSRALHFDFDDDLIDLIFSFVVVLLPLCVLWCRCRVEKRALFVSFGMKKKKKKKKKKRK